MWGKELAGIWTNNVPPSRPSPAEMCVYTSYLRKIQAVKRGKLKLLVLGSTPEFRDWGFDEAMDITVADMSPEYYREISREIRHKNLKERLVVTQWEDMRFNTQFDIIVGDLAVGQISSERLDDFINSVYLALAPGGYCVGKSFFWTKEDVVCTPEQIIQEYRQYLQIHPYTFINHRLGLYCLNKQTSYIDFGKMYEEMLRLCDEGVVEPELFLYFRDIGWNTEMKFLFYSPSRDYFADRVNKKLSFVKFEETTDYYTDLFPIYVIHKPSAICSESTCT